MEPLIGTTVSVLILVSVLCMAVAACMPKKVYCVVMYERPMRPEIKRIYTNHDHAHQFAETVCEHEKIQNHNDDPAIQVWEYPLWK
jgi:hypothetical protein